MRFRTKLKQNIRDLQFVLMLFIPMPKSMHGARARMIEVPGYSCSLAKQKNPRSKKRNGSALFEASTAVFCTCIMFFICMAQSMHGERARMIEVPECSSRIIHA